MRQRQFRRNDKAWTLIKQKYAIQHQLTRTSIYHLTCDALLLHATAASQSFRLRPDVVHP